MFVCLTWHRTSYSSSLVRIFGSYQLISLVLGLSAYNVVRGENLSTILSELKVQAGKKEITIDFSSTAMLNTKSGLNPLCASFGHQNGKITLSNQMRPNVCVATRQGRFGLVVESPLMPLKGKVSKWKIAILSSIVGALGACLLSLLLLAMFVTTKKKARMDELERRAYQKGALQVSMVGHVRAVTTNGTRFVPTIEHYEYRNDSHS